LTSKRPGGGLHTNSAKLAAGAVATLGVKYTGCDFSQTHEFSIHRHPLQLLTLNDLNPRSKGHPFWETTINGLLWPNG